MNSVAVGSVFARRLRQTGCGLGDLPQSLHARQSGLGELGAGVGETLSQRRAERPFRGLIKFGREHQEVDGVEFLLEPRRRRVGERPFEPEVVAANLLGETDGIPADDNALLFVLAVDVGNVLYELGALHYGPGERCQEGGPWWQRLGVEGRKINAAVRLQRIRQLGPERNDESQNQFQEFGRRPPRIW
jgi:hypothetical protein